MSKRWKTKKLRGKSKGKNLFIILIVGVGCIFFMKQIGRFAKMKTQKNDLKTEISELKTDNTKLNKRIKNLHNDKEYVEKIAREELNLAKEGETTFIVVNE